MSDDNSMASSIAGAKASVAAPVERLWRLWREGQRPDVRAFLAAAGDLKPEQIAAVLLHDQRERWQTGERIPAEWYLSLYPPLQADVEYGVELVYGEFLMREELGETAHVGEYQRRFPQYLSRLQLQWQLHEAVNAGSPTPCECPTAIMGERGAGHGGDIAPEHGEMGSAKSRASAEPPATATPWPVVPGYRIEGELGRGGMSIAYKAWHAELKRSVALKMVRAGDCADSEMQQRFQAEAQTIARLYHPNIVQIYEVGAYQDRPYFALELVNGGTLAEKLNGTPQHAHQAAQLVETLSLAIHYAHQNGIVHRDLKPSNILLARTNGPTSPTEQKTPPKLSLSDYHLKITDFGLAKQLDAATAHTRSGTIVGTPSYMAPEQAGAKNREITPATDVYALGAILYEVVTGRPPFKAATVLETLERVRSTQPEPPRRLQPKLPADLETITLKCLEKDPQRRYPTALELAQELRRFLENRPIQARRTARLVRAWRWCRRNPGWAAAAGLLLVVVVAISLLALNLNVSLGRTQQAERQATDRLFEALVTRVQGSRGSGQPGQRFANLDSLRQAAEIARAQNRPAADLLRLRNEAIACLALPDLQLEAEWEGNPPGTNGLGFDASFQHYAWSFRDEGIRVCRLVDHGEQLRLPTPPTDCPTRWVLLSFSPNGRYLAAHYVQWQKLHPLEVWDLSVDTGRRILAVPDATALPAFTVDSRSLLAPLPGGVVAVVDLPSGHERRRLASGGPIEALAAQPGGKLLAVAGGESEGVRVLELETGAVARRLPHPDGVQGLAWSADGKLLATACNDLYIRLWDTISWQEQGKLAGHRWEVGDLAFDPTGKWLASFGWDMTLRIWDVGSLKQLLDVEDIRVLGFRNQGGLAAAGLTGHRVQVWDFRPSEVLQGLHGLRTLHANVYFSPDGLWMMTTAAAGEDLRVWDTRTWQQVYQKWGKRGSVLWGPDGAWILTQGNDGFRRVPVLTGQQPPTFRFGQPRHLTGFLEDVFDHYMTWVGTDGRRFLLIDPFDGRSPQSRVRMLEINDVTIRVLWDGRWPNASAIAGSRDGSLVAIGSYGGGRGVSLWDAETGRLLRELPIGDARVRFSPDGRRLYTTTSRLSPGGAECRSWWIGSGEMDRSLPLLLISHSPSNLCVAADGTVAVVFTKTDMRLLDPDTLEEIMTLSGPEPASLSGFSPDGATLVTTSNGSVHIWDLRGLRQELARHGFD
jgi:serine/threonine protein kinase/WD40 repeat protein